MTNINVSNLTFSYINSYENIFDNVTFNIDASWKLGLIGRNARGKTTLLNLLMNKYEYKGKITSKINFSYFPYVIDNPEKSVLEIIDDNWKIHKELSLLDISKDVLHRPFNTLSEGEKTKILLAIMFVEENNFKLLDEPTNHLDEEGRKVLSNYLNQKEGFILVSHDRAFLDNCIDHVMSINKNNIEIVSGNFSTWNENKQNQDNYEIELNSKLKTEIKRLTKASKEKANWSDKVEASKYQRINPEAFDKGYIGHKAAKMMKSSKAIEKRIESQIKTKKSLLKNIEVSENLKINPLTFHSKQMIVAKKLSFFYGDECVVNNINFDIIQGSKIHIKGKNGSGKTTLVKMIIDENIKFNGDFYKANGLIISYVKQDTSFLKGKLSDFESLENIDVSLFRAVLRKLDFKRDDFDKLIESYSEGQKKKLLIAKSLSERAHIYIWDEPLNYVDVLSRIQIENLIKSCTGTFIFIEHDQTFCENVADYVISLH